MMREALRSDTWTFPSAEFRPKDLRMTAGGDGVLCQPLFF